MLCFGAMSLQGTAIGWIGIHCEHHARTDRPGDPHSPYQYEGLKGIAWAHSGWMCWDHDTPPAPNRIETDKLLLWQRKYYVLFVIATFAIPILVGTATGGLRGGIDSLFVAGFFRIVVQLNASWSVNSICHVVGRRVEVIITTPATATTPIKVVKYLQSDGSRNFWPLALLTLGESYHALHHLRPKSAYHGWEIRDLDVTKWVIMLLRYYRLVWAVETPPLNVVIRTSPNNELKLVPGSFLSQIYGALAA
jgi:stearoyl-CoA desaturase (Delta-9 desaturase)